MRSDRRSMRGYVSGWVLFVLILCVLVLGAAIVYLQILAGRDWQNPVPGPHELPIVERADEGAAPAAGLVVGLAGDGRLFVADRNVSLKALEEMLRPDGTVRLRLHRAAPWSRVKLLLAVAARRGVREVALRVRTEQPEEGQGELALLLPPPPEREIAVQPTRLRLLGGGAVDMDGLRAEDAGKAAAWVQRLQDHHCEARVVATIDGAPEATAQDLAALLFALGSTERIVTATILEAAVPADVLESLRLP